MYEYDSDPWEITYEDRRIFEIFETMLEYHYSMRRLSKEMHRSVSSLYRDLEKLKYISYNMYKAVKGRSK